jgi:hypothetical protein
MGPHKNPLEAYTSCKSSFAKWFMETLKDKSLQRGCGTSMEASYGHLPITPLHGGLRGVKGKVDGFTEL